MSFNGAGLFLINTAGQPVVTNTVISSSVFNAFAQDIATGLSTCLTRDGQSAATANIPMGGFKFTNLGLGVSGTDAANVSNANILNMCEFRLTMTTGVPVTTADVTGTTVFWTPYKGNRIALYDGTSWHMRTSAELSFVAGGLTNGRVYDVFVFDNAGVPTLETLIWTNDTTRATALTLQDGVLVKTGAVTRRYVGTVKLGGGGNFGDTMALRWVWNYYNRVLRLMRVLEATATWNYTVNTIRQANGAGANQLGFLVGVNEEMVSAYVQAACANTNTLVPIAVGIGLDVTNAFTAGSLCPFTTTAVAGAAMPVSAAIKLYPGVGAHFLAWNEVSTATGTTTWYGANGQQSGIHGEVWG